MDTNFPLSQQHASGRPAAISPVTLLDELGIRRITDKSSLYHDYLDKYERLFAPFRDAPITILEIGVLDGASLRLWEDYFPRATIVGVDIRDACKEHQGGRRIVEIASQADGKAMAIIGQRHRPAIIIDDGSHRADHILSSFEALFPSLRDGGMYIVEDLGVHAGPSADRHRGSAPNSPQAYFLTLANRVACPAEEVNVNPMIFSAVASIELFYCIAVIKKKEAPNPDRIESRRAIIQELDSSQTWGWFSDYIINNGGSKEEAIECARRAAAMAPLEPAHCAQLSRALEFAGRVAEALDAAKQAQRLAPNHLSFSDRVDRLTLMLQDQKLAARS